MTAAADFEHRASDACLQVGPETMFPEHTDLPAVAEARRVCLSCENRVECREGAIARGERFGVWGGLTGHDLEALRKRTARRNARVGGQTETLFEVAL